MDAHERARSAAMTVVIRDTPRDFWSELRARTRILYGDIFNEIANDRAILPQQRIDKLLQDRHFRMEKLLIDLASRHGLANTTTRLVENNRCYAYVTRGDIGITQAYVPDIGHLPQAARYRERLAEAMGLPRLDLGDEPTEALIGKQFYGLIAHNPVGRRFLPDDQKLGMIQLCFPAVDCKAWAVEFAIEEIIAAYPETKGATKPRRELAWKERKLDQPKRDDSA